MASFDGAASSRQGTRIVEQNPLGDEHRLVRAFALDDDVPGVLRRRRRREASVRASDEPAHARANPPAAAR